MGKTEKKVNKWIIGAVIGSTLIGIGGLSMTPKGRSFWQRVLKKTKRGLNYLKRGVRDLKRLFWK